jgi:RNA polymerase sigma factor (sigma-70 family)
MPYEENSVAKRFLRGDVEALGQVMRWISQSLTAPRFWSLRHEWPDLAQEVLSRVVESLVEERYDESRDLRLYVQGIARHAAFRALDRARASLQAAQSEPADGVSESDPERSAVDRQLVRRALDLASEECRQILKTYFFEGLDYAAIAAHMGIPEGTVKSRLFRCLQRISETMERSCSLEVDARPLAPPRFRRSSRITAATKPDPS